MNSLNSVFRIVLSINAEIDCFKKKIKMMRAESVRQRSRKRDGKPHSGLMETRCRDLGGTMRSDTPECVLAVA